MNTSTEEYMDLQPSTKFESFTDTLELVKELDGQHIKLQGKYIEVGRHNMCDLVIDSRSVARYHAAFLFENGVWYIMDHKSANKTFINGAPIEPGKKYKLHVGDMLSFGAEKYSFFKSVANSRPVTKPIASAVNPEFAPSIKKAVPETLIGKTIGGKYRILSEIGRSGVSVFYLGYEEHANMTCAIQAVSKTVRHIRLIVDAQKREARMMQFDHPLIPKVFGLSEDEKNIYIIREHISGVRLDEIIKKRGAVSDRTAVEWAIRICDALQCMHTNNPPYVFQNMNPAHIMLQPDGNLKLIGFEIASYNDSLKQGGSVLENRGYAAPEQFVGNADGRADIFGLGMTLYYMVTSRDPNNTPYMPIRKTNPRLPEKLELIIARCVEPDANNRFQTAEELKKALLGDGPIMPTKSIWEKLFAKKEKEKTPSTTPVKPTPARIPSNNKK